MYEGVSGNGHSWILKSLGYKTFYFSDNLNRPEVTPWNFDIYKMTVKGISLAGGTATRIDCRLINIG